MSARHEVVMVRPGHYVVRAVATSAIINRSIEELTMGELPAWKKRQLDLEARRESNVKWREKMGKRRVEDERAAYLAGADEKALLAARAMRNALIQVVATFKPKTEMEHATIAQCHHVLGIAHTKKPLSMRRKPRPVGKRS